MKPQLLITSLIVCVLGHQSLQAQFFYPKKCVNPDSIFVELQAGTLNAWASMGYRREKSAGQQQENWFSNTTLNYVPLRGLETGIHFNKPIPHKQAYSYRYSNEYVPYARYTLFSNGCFRYAFWSDISYHIDRKRSKEDVLSRSNSPAAGFGVYKTVGRLLWLQTHTEFYIGEKTVRHEFRLIWKMARLNFRKKA